MQRHVLYGQPTILCRQAAFLSICSCKLVVGLVERHGKIGCIDPWLFPWQCFSHSILILVYCSDVCVTLST